MAVFSIQGWTDDLFPAVESFRQFKSLKRRDSSWPVEVAVADVGHSRAQNRPETWHRLNDQAWQWLQSHIQGSHDQHTTVSSQQTVCGGTTPAKDVTADSPEGLANGTLTVQYPGGYTANPPGVTDPNGPATDAIASEVVEPGEKCKHSDGPALGGYTAYSPPLKDETTTIGIGVVHVPYTAIGATTATLNVRLFDRASSDKSKKCPTQQANGSTQPTTTGQNQTSGDTTQDSSQTPGSTSDTTNNTAQGHNQPADSTGDTTQNTTPSADLKDGGPWLLRNLTDGKPHRDDQKDGGKGGDKNDKTPADDHAAHDTGQGDGTSQGGDQATPTQDAATNGTSQTAGSNASGDSGQCELLISRGTYRINEPAGSGELDVPFYGNHWKLASGHQIRLDITQVDQPTYQPSKEPSAFAFDDGVTLTLPTLESGDKTLEASAAEFPPTLLDLSKLPHKLARFVADAAAKVVGTINGVTGTVDEITGKGKDVTGTTENADGGQLPSDVGGVVDVGDGGSGSGDTSDGGGGGTGNDGGGHDKASGGKKGSGGSDTGSKLPVGRAR